MSGRRKSVFGLHLEENARRRNAATDSVGPAAETATQAGADARASSVSNPSAAAVAERRNPQPAERSNLLKILRGASKACCLWNGNWLSFGVVWPCWGVAGLSIVDLAMAPCAAFQAVVLALRPAPSPSSSITPTNPKSSRSNCASWCGSAWRGSPDYASATSRRLPA